MNEHIFTTRVDYSLTDAMGFMHHSNYMRIYENARWDFFRKLGLPYSEIEHYGYWMPVIGVNLKYHKPAFYDDELQIKVKFKSQPRVKFPIEYTMFKDGEIINEGIIELAFMKKGGEKACRAPQFIQDSLAPIF